MARARRRGTRWTGLYRDENDKQKSAGTFDTEADALKAARHAEALANPVTPVEVHPVLKRGKVTVAAYASKWLDGLSVEPNTRDTYANSVKHIVKRIGSMAVADVQTDDIRAIVRALEKLGRSDATIRHVMVVAFLVFEQAARSKVRDDNPCDGVRVKIRGQREMLVATREQARAIEDAVNQRFKLLVQALFATGCRWSEMIAVKGTDVELIAAVRRQLTDDDIEALLDEAIWSRSLGISSAGHAVAPTARGLSVPSLGRSFREHPKRRIRMRMR